MLVGLSGFMGSGKDAAADVLCHKFNFHRLSFAKALKDEIQMALATGIIPSGIHEAGQDAFLTCLALELMDPFAKPTTPEMRTLLQQWGTEFRRKQDENYWVNKVRNGWYAMGRPDMVVTDVRFLNELRWIKSEGGICILIDRTRRIYDPNLLLHESEKLVGMRDEFDFICDNTREDPSLRLLTNAVTQIYWEAHASQAA